MLIGQRRVEVCDFEGSRAESHQEESSFINGEKHRDWAHEIYL